MIRTWFSSAALLLAVSTIPGIAYSSPAGTGPKVLLHLGATGVKNPCTALDLANCNDALTAGGLSTPAGPFYFVSVVAARGSLPTLNSMAIGLTYQGGAPGGKSDGVGVDIFSWEGCIGYALGDHPDYLWGDPVGARLFVLDDDNCVSDESINLGYFYMGAYSSDTMRFIPRPVDNAQKVGTCEGMEVDLLAEDLGHVAFSAGSEIPGCNPCVAACEDVIPVEASTWGRIKSLSTE